MLALPPRERSGLIYVGGEVLKTVVIVDNDLGFVFWLGHGLDTHGYSALPARSVADAALLSMQLDLTIDILIINPALPGAIDFIAAIHRSQPDVRVIGILDSSSPAVSIPGVHATQTKPSSLGELIIENWVNCIDRLCMNSSVERAVK